MRPEAAQRFADLTERIIYLRAIPVAAMLSPPVLKIIATQLRDVSFAAGSYLMRQGQPIEALYFITSGRCSLVRSGKPFGTLSPPQSLGFLGILAHGDGTYDAMADEHTTTLALDAETIIELHEDHFELLRATVHYLCERLAAEIREMRPEDLSMRLQGEGVPVPSHELDLVERMVMLRKFRAFRKTNMSSVAALSRRVIEARYPAGTTIWRAGDVADRTLFLVNGTGRCSAPDGRTWSVSPISALGGIEAVSNLPRWYTMEAETPITGMWIPVSAFEEALEDDFELATDFMATVASQLVDALERKAALGQTTVGVLREVSKLGAVKVGA